jgi:nucleoside-diphosphate-sugar epimerase
MKVLITGASGFVGSHVTRLLLSKGYEVHAICRKSSNLWRIQDTLSSLNIIHYDLQSIALKNVLQEIQPESCIHLAWYAEPGKYLHSLENLNSLHASLDLLLVLAQVGCKRFVGIGTCFEYNLNLGYLSESSATEPQHIYAATKVALSTVLKEIGSITGMSTAWLRLFYQYGPMEDERRLVANVITALLQGSIVQTTEGKQVRDFLHIEDVASAILAVTQSDLQGVINIGSGQPVTVRELGCKIGELLERPHLIEWGALPYRANDPMFVCANNSLLLTKTNWTQTYDLTGGLQHTIDWLKQNFKHF